MAKIKREELSGKFLEAFDKIVKLKNSDDAKQREAGLKGEKALEKLLSSKKGEAVKKEVKPKSKPKAKAKPKSKAKPKAKSKAKPKAKTKTSTTPKVLPFSTRASNLMKKEGLSWADAKAKLSKEIKDEKDKIEAKLKADKKQALNELEKLTKAPEFQKALSQYPKKGGGKKRAIKTTLSNDGKRQALPRGKRVSKNGKTYYEYRDNRSDVNSLPAPKGQYRYKGKTPPYLADGGAIDSLKKDMNSKLDIHSEYYAKGGRLKVYDESYDVPIKTFNSFEKAKNWVLANHKKYDEITIEDAYLDTIVVDKTDTKDDIEFLFSDNMAKGGELTSYGLSFEKVDYDVNVNPKNLEVDVNIKKSDSVNQLALNDTDAEWTQFYWGYMVYPKNEKQLYDVLKALKVSVSQKRLSNFLNDGSYAKGGRTISIVNDGVTFDKSKYKAVYGDFDNDGTVNIDDANPLDKTKSGQVEQVELRKTFDKLLGVKAELDEIMYDAVETLDEKAPEGADIYARTKTPYSILKKLVEKRMLDPKRGLTDMIGTTIAVDNQKELEQVRDKIDGGLLGKVLDRDDFYKTPNAGYRAYHYIVEYKGVPVEVQLKTKNMKKLHEVSHEAYKNGTLNAKSLDSLSKTFMRADKGDAKAKAEISKLLSDKKLLASKFSKGSMAKGGEILKPRNKRKGDIGNRNKKINVDTIIGDRAMKMIYYDLKGNPEKEEIVSYESGVERIKFDILWLGIYDDYSTNNKTHYTFYRNDNKSLSNRKVDYQEIKMYAKGGEVKDVDWANSTDIVDVGVWFLEENYKKGNIFQSERYNISHKDLLDKLKSGKRDSKTIDQLKDMLFANGQNYSTSLYLKGYYGEDERILGEDIYYSIPDEYAKGGLTDSKYIPSYEIYEVVTKDGKVYENDYSAMEFLSGAYVSDKVVTESDEKDKNQMTLFDKGGNIPKGAIYIKRRDIDFITVGEDEDDKEKVSGKNLFNGFWIDPKKQKTLIAEATKDGRLGKSKAKVGDKVKLIKGAGSETVFRNFPNGEYEVKKVKKGNKVVPEGFYEIENKDGNRTQLATSRFAIPMAKGGMTDGDTLGDFKKRLLELGDKEFVEYKEKQLKKQDLYYAFRDRLKNVHKQTIVIKDDLPFKKGGKIGFDGLAKKVAKKYEGTRVPKEYQEQYGKTYNKKEAMEVGKKVAGKVYRQQQSMEAGGTLPTPFGQAGLVGETGAMNEMDLFAMGGGLPQGVHQYYGQTYNPAYPTPHGYAKGGEIKSVAKAIYEPNEQFGGIETSRGKKTLKGLENMIDENDAYDVYVALESNFEVQPKGSPKIATTYGDKTMKGLIAMIENSKGSYAKGGMIEEWSIQTDNNDEHFDNEEDAREFWESLSNKERKSGQYFRKSYFSNQDGELEEDEVEIIQEYAKGGRLGTKILKSKKFKTKEEAEKSLNNLKNLSMYDKDGKKIILRGIRIEKEQDGYIATASYLNKDYRLAKGGEINPRRQRIIDEIKDIQEEILFISKNPEGEEEYFKNLNVALQDAKKRLGNFYNVPENVMAKGGSIKVGDKVKYPKATMVGKVKSIKDSDFERTLTIEYDDGKIIKEGESSVIKLAKGGFTEKDTVLIQKHPSGFYVVYLFNDKYSDNTDYGTSFMERFETLKEAKSFANKTAKENNASIKMAKGGKTKRSKHSLMQDRRRVSSESWEVAYQKRKAKMEAGGTLPTPFGQAGLVGETGTMNEMDLFAMGGGLPQGVHQYYGQTYNPAYPTPHGYAKGGEITKTGNKGSARWEMKITDDEGNTSSIYAETKSDLLQYKKMYLAKGGATSSDTSDVYFFAYEEFMKNGKKFKSEKELYDFVNDGYSFPKYSKKSVKSAFKTLNEEMYAKGGKTQESKLLSKIRVGNIIPTNKGNYEIIELQEETGNLDNYDGGFSYFKVKDENDKVNYIKISREKNPKMFINDKPLYSSSWKNAKQIFAKGGKTQGYNDKLDESLGNTKGKRSTKEQNYKDRRNESEAMEKKGGKRKYASVKTMDKGNRKKRQTPMSLAKEIRKEGEKWQDAVKRASAMLKKK